MPDPSPQSSQPAQPPRTPQQSTFAHQLDAAQTLAVAIEAARLGAAQLMHYRDQFSVREKAPKDLVTDADLASQQAVFARLRESFPLHAMVGEEEGQDQPPSDADGRPRSDIPCWIVDPLDGTINYVHHLQSFCVSIALAAEGHLQVGVVLDPVSEELFYATRGGGAFVSRPDGSQVRPLRVSACAQLERALLACSFPAGVRKDAIEVRQFCEVLEACQTLRRLGSCALNLCYLAAGRLDGYWAQSVKSWDMAAGALMVAEAGGLMTNFDGAPVDLWHPVFAATASEQLQQALLAKLRAA